MCSVSGVLWGPPSMLNSSLSPGELLQWLEGQHLLHGLMASEDPVLVYSPHSPCPRPLAITTTAATGQLPPTLSVTAASVAAPGKTC